MKVQVHQKLLNQYTWKFDTMLRTWNSVLRCNMMTSQQIQYGGILRFNNNEIYCPINAKFCVKEQNHVQTQVTWPKYQILQIQDGGRPPFWKWFHHYISAADHPISMKFVCRCIIWLQERSIIKVSKFCKFKMADGRFVCEQLHVGLQISLVLWVNRRCPPILIVSLYKDKSAISTH